MGKGFQNISAGMQSFPDDFRDFGFRVALQRFAGFSSENNNRKYLKTVSLYVEKSLRPLIDRYSEPGYQSILCEKKVLTKIPIWFCRLSASETLTDAENLCYKRLLHMTPQTARVHVLTLKNVSDYIDLPPLIIRRYQNREMNLKELREYIRAAVLGTYGGLWIDPTVFVTSMLPDGVLQAQLFSIKTRENNPQAPSAGYWNSAVISVHKNHVAMCFVRDAFLFWWERYDRPIAEDMFDLFLSAAFRSLPPVRFAFDAMPPSNPAFSSFRFLLNQPYDNKTYREISVNNVFLDTSGTDVLFKETADHRPTYFGKLYFDELYSL